MCDLGWGGILVFITQKTLGWLFDAVVTRECLCRCVSSHGHGQMRTLHTASVWEEKLLMDYSPHL